MQHRELCGVHKSGGPGLPLNTLVKCSKIAAVKVDPTLHPDLSLEAIG
jgi:hypothetical protein